MNLLDTGHRDSDKVDRDHEHISIDVFANNPVGAAVDPPTDNAFHCEVPRLSICDAVCPYHRSATPKLVGATSPVRWGTRRSLESSIFPQLHIHSVDFGDLGVTLVDHRLHLVPRVELGEHRLRDGACLTSSKVLLRRWRRRRDDVGGRGGRFLVRRNDGGSVHVLRRWRCRCEDARTRLGDLALSALDFGVTYRLAALG